MNALDIRPEMSSAQFAEQSLRDLGFDMDKNVANEIGLIIRWLFHANNELGVSIQLETKQTSLPVVECQVKKPCDFVKLLKLTVGKCCTVPIYTEPVRRRGGVFQYGDYAVQEKPYFFDLSSNAEGCDLNIEYKAYNFDENGYPFIDLTYREALLAYVRWKLIIMFRGRGKGALAGFTSGDEDKAFGYYLKFAGSNRARKRMDALTEDAVNQITAKWCDPLYVPTNPYLRQIQQHNTAYIHGERNGYHNTNSRY